MAGFIFESGNALLLLREVHLQSWINSWAIFLPQNRDLSVSTGLNLGFAGLKFPKFFQKPLTKPDSATNSPNIGTFGPISTIFYEMKWNEYMLELPYFTTPTVN